MYQIKSGDTWLHHPYSEDAVAIEAKLSEELNTHGSLDMVLKNPVNIGLLSPVEVYDDDGMIWRGRILTMERGFDSRRTIHCEGALAYLCDTIVQPFSFRGRPNDYTSGGQTVKGLFHHFIDQHNANLAANDPRRFTVGEVTVEDPNNYIYRSSETAMTTWEAINTRLIDTLGGYVYLSGENLNVINYVRDFDAMSHQILHFRENIVDLMQTDGADNVVTVLYAYGAQNDEEHTEPEPGGEGTTGFYSWNGNRVHLSAPVEYPAGIDKWGRIVGTMTWDDITVVENLSTAAWHWLIENYTEHVESMEITAADLSLNDPTIEKLNVGAYCSVICEPINLSLLMLCKRKETNLIDVSDTRVFVGKAPLMISSMVGGG